MEDEVCYCINPVEGDKDCMHCNRNIEFITHDCVVTGACLRDTEDCNRQLVSDPPTM